MTQHKQAKADHRTITMQDAILRLLPRDGSGITLRQLAVRLEGFRESPIEKGFLRAAVRSLAGSAKVRVVEVQEEGGPCYRVALWEPKWARGWQQGRSSRPWFAAVPA